jgi:two-component system cell cycle response regulator
MKILVIDDNPVDVKLFRCVLSMAGHDVSGVEAADAALAAIKQAKPQVILVDLALPGMDGMTLVRKVKADPETRDILVVVVTGHPSWWKKAEAIKAGCDAYLLKPVNTRDLPQHLSEMAARKTGPDKPATRLPGGDPLRQARRAEPGAPNPAKKRRRHERPDC